MRTALTLLFLLLLAPAANAASVAYIADGEVWLASLDGSQRVKLAGHVTNSRGVIEKWSAVAQADNGRIVASRNEPGKISSLSGSRPGSRTAPRPCRARSTAGRAGWCTPTPWAST